MPLPNIPTEVLIIVAEFLAGDRAFGTLAALHMADREMQMEILPVLYETLFMDNKNHLLPFLEDERTLVANQGFKYTKSVSCSQSVSCFAAVIDPH